MKMLLYSSQILQAVFRHPSPMGTLIHNNDGIKVLGLAEQTYHHQEL